MDPQHCSPLNLPGLTSKKEKKKQSSFYTYPALLTVVHGSTTATPISVNK
jgi:hypothetical protein